MKKILKMIMITLLTLFSFYYTERVIDLSKREDPIMKEILNKKEEKEVMPINGVIERNSIIVGTSGKKIDIEKSYEKMKKLNKYNDNLLEYINIKPLINIENSLDKTVKGSLTRQRKISIVFKTNDIDMIKQIDYILNKNNMESTVFMDGKELENNLLDIKNNISDNIFFGIYSYNETFNRVSGKYVKNLLSNNLNFSNYCLYKDDEFLKACKFYKINTIEPVFIKNNIYNYFKNNKENGLIYEINVNKNNIKQLNSTLGYLNQKGYKVVNLDKLLKN